MTIRMVNPCAESTWDETLPESPACGFFHSQAWARTLCDAYGYNPCYFEINDKENARAVQPFMEVNSKLTGKRGVSLPFTDLCPSPGLQPSLEAPLANAVFDYAKQRQWRYIEWRSGGQAFIGRPPFQTYLGHTIPLGGSEDALKARLRSSKRQNIERARDALTVEILDSRDALDAFYRLQVITRRRHGLPPQPRRFFDCVHQHILSRGHGLLVQASYRGTPVAINVCFHFRKQAMYKFGASDLQFQHLRANDLVMWESIRWYREHGYDALNLGRTDPANSGLCQFKKGWGAEIEQIHYHRYDQARHDFVTDSRQPDRYAAAFRILPGFALRMLGSLLYRHMG